MVRADSAPDFDVHVLVGGEVAAEYNDENAEDAADSVNRYVQSESDTKWAVRVTMRDSVAVRSQAWVILVLCDGRKLVDRPLYVPELHSTLLRVQGHVNLEIGDLRVSLDDGSDCFRAFKFGRAELTDEHLDRGEMARILEKGSKMGAIEVQLWPYKILRTTNKPETLAKSQDNVDAVGKLPEKALKGRALSHSMKFGEEERVSRRGMATVCHGHYLGKEPRTRYKFKYLSKEALRAMLIVPRTPSPERSATPQDDIDDLTPEQLRAKLRALRDQTAPRANQNAGIKPEIKREFQENEGDENIEIVEPPRKKVRSNEVIDLT